MVCYDAAGYSNNHVPCAPEADVSTCCPRRSDCTQNLYCAIRESGNHNNLPGSCTESTWGKRQIAECPCPFVDRGDGTQNYMDGVTFCYDGSYCCGRGNFDCCKAGNGTAVIAFRQYGLPPFPVSAPSSTTVTTTVIQTSSITESITTSITKSTTLTETPTSTTTTVISTTMTTLPVPSQSMISLSACTKEKKDIGAGVGVAFGVLWLLTLLCFYLLWRKYLRLGREVGGEMTQGPAEGPAKGPSYTNLMTQGPAQTGYTTQGSSPPYHL